ncbi:DUF2169 family type VI secretion system accessory protein [Chondromyces crocatus]|uniref:DUF2169 domain-containing protein n=1 Tax=Chondromyces crocatus TaxID=52 RepID=A0A0K1ESE3_CHOCO|nr:DUF2169 domain-containing protein [Chondromyces crocatus]AKT43714.1 uncharacterized protein CMC5_079490 [Chondromyces crocatus]
MIREAPWPLAISTLGPVACGALLWRARGQLYATVIVKATLGIANEADMTLESPESLLREEVHHQDIPTRSVRATTDLVPYLRQADVVLTGHAHATEGPVSTLDVRLALFREQSVFDKVLRVVGDRRGEEPSAPFEHMPLTYERAYGGIGWKDNPFGTGIGGAKKVHPNVLDPQDPERTAGFGPIARGWPARKQMLDAGARKALELPIPVVSEGVDYAYFQSAPLDQRCAYLVGDEWILLEGLHPTLPRVRSRLPNLKAMARVHGLTDPSPPFGRPIELLADTLRIDTDTQRVELVWRALLPVRNEEHAAGMHIVVAIERPGETTAWPESPPAEKVQITFTEDTTDALEVDDNATTLVRSPGEKKATPWTQAAKRPPAAPSKASLPVDEGTMALSADELSEAGQRAELPFDREVERPRAVRDETVAISPESERGEGRSSLPFKTTSSPLVPRPSATTTPLPGAPWAQQPAKDAPVASPITEETTFPLPPGPRQSVPAPPLPSRPLSVPPAPPRPTGGSIPPPPSRPAAPSAPATAAVSASRFFHAPHTEPTAQGAPPAPPTGISPPGDGRGAPNLPERPSDAIPMITGAPLLAFTLSWQVKPPHDARVVIVKATFDLVPDGKARLRSDPDLPTGDMHAEGDPVRSVLYPSDFAIFKPRADVTLSGHAYAPGRGAPAARARFQFGQPGAGFDRRIAVFGERRWERAVVALAPTEPRPFVRIPLLHENAYGGPGFDANPVGSGRAAGPDGAVYLPLLEDPERLIRDPNDAPTPVGFGAVPARWRRRADLLGTYDARWHKERWPWFPEDFDWAYFQAAPPAQQLDTLRGDEPFALEGMHPDHPRLEGRLPGLRARAFAQRTREAGGELIEVRLRLDTAHFDVDALKLNLVWRGVLEVRDDDASEIAEIFVMSESTSEPPARPEEVMSQYLAARAARGMPSEDPGALPANDGAAAPADPAGDRVRERLAGASVPAVGAAAAAAALAPPADTPASGAASPAGAPVTPMTPAEAAAVRAEIEARLVAGESLDGLDLAGADLSSMDLAGRSLVGTNLQGARLIACRLSGANLTEAQLSHAALDDAQLDGANLTRADLTEASLTGARLDGAELSSADLSRAKAFRASFRKARGEHPNLSGADLSEARFEGAEILGPDLTAASLDGAIFDGAVLPAIRLYDARGARVSFREARLEGARADGVSLVGASFDGLQARGGVWDRAALDGASFLGATLCESSFARASAERAIFSNADLTDGRLGRAALAGASFIKANLMRANLESTDLTGADLRGANLHAAETWKAKLSGARLELALVTQTKLKEGS